MHLLGFWGPGNEASKEGAALCEGGLSLFFGPQLNAIENESAALVYQGRIFDRTDEALLANPAATEDAYGVYTYVRRDRHSGEVHIGTDRLGIGPLYYAQEGETLLFSTSLPLLKEQLKRASIDIEAWEEIIALQHILGDKTPIKEIRRLRAGQKIVLRNQRVSFETVWEPQEPVFVGEDGFAERNNGLLEDALSLTKAAAGAKVMLLSGGDDSRRLAAAALRTGLPIQLATQSAPGTHGLDPDSRIAEKVASYFDLPIHVEPAAAPQDFFADCLLRDASLGFEAPLHEWIMPLLRNLPAGALVYDGALGGVVVNGHAYRAYPRHLECYEDLDAVTRLVIPEEHPFKASPHMTDSTLFERVRAEFERLPASPISISYFYLLTRTRRAVTLWHQLLYQQDQWPCLPFLYGPLLEHSLALSPRLHLDKHFQYECMKQLDPALADLPSTRRAVPKELTKDLSELERKRQKVYGSAFYMRDDVLDLFPSLKKRAWLYKFAMKRGMKRALWFCDPMFRMSLFMDWLEGDGAGLIPKLPPPPGLNKSK